VNQLAAPAFISSAMRRRPSSGETSSMTVQIVQRLPPTSRTVALR
jgi:hypothetical protein